MILRIILILTLLLARPVYLLPTPPTSPPRHTIYLPVILIDITTCLVSVWVWEPCNDGTSDWCTIVDESFVVTFYDHEENQWYVGASGDYGYVYGYFSYGDHLDYNSWPNKGGFTCYRNCSKKDLKVECPYIYWDSSWIRN